MASFGLRDGSVNRNGDVFRMPNDPPSGILSRRVFQSPVIKWVFPTRMRHPEKHDLMLVGENLVELREWDPEAGHLRRVAAKADFGSTIRHAKVLGRRVYSDDLDLRREDAETTASGLGHFVPQMVVLTFCSSDFVLLTAIESEDGTVSFKVHRRRLPVHKPLEQAGKFIATEPGSRALAISASENTLILYGLLTEGLRTTTTFSELIQRELILRLDMAVLKMDFLYPPREDPDNVTLVVLGVKRGKISATVYSWDYSSPLRPYNVQINKQTLGREHGIPFSLIPLKTAGYFLLVEEHRKFLYLVSSGGLLEQTDAANLEFQPVDNETGEQLRAPSPAKHLWVNWARPVRRADWESEAVYLAREDGLVKYLQVAIKPWASRLKFDLNGDAGDFDCAIDTAFTILDMPQARWTPPPGEQEGMDHGEPLPNEVPNYKIGYPDILVVPGNFSDGGLYEIGFISTEGDEKLLTRAQLHEPQLRVHFRNWAPFTDLTVAKAKRGKPGASHAIRPWQHEDWSYTPLTRDRVFATSGKDPHGMIAELRFGLEVMCKIPRIILPTVVAQDPEFDLQYCNGIWPLQLPSMETAVLFSFPWRTVFAKFDHDTLTISLIESDLGGHVSCGEPTLAAGKYISGEQEDVTEGNSVQHHGPVIICVTSTQIQLWRINRIPHLHEPSLSARIAGSWQVLSSYVAACQRNGPWILVASQSREDGAGPMVSLKRVSEVTSGYDLISVGQGVNFKEELSCITFLELGLRDDTQDSMETTPDASTLVDLVAVGTVSGIVHILSIDHQDGLQYLFEYDASDHTSNVTGSSAIESIAAISASRSPNDSITLLCGSREGSMHILPINFGKTPRVRDATVVKFGSDPENGVPLRVMTNTEKPGSFFAWSGSDIYQVDLARAPLHQRPQITSVLYTDPLDHTFAHGTVKAICHLPRLHFSGPLAGCLISVSGSEILAGNVESSAQPLPIRRKIPGTPSKLKYSEHLKALIAVSVLTEIHQNRRYSIPAVAILSPSADPSGTDGISQRAVDNYEFSRSCFRLKPGERVRDMAEWVVSKKKEEYHFIVVATSISKKGGGEAGRMVVLRPARGVNGDIKLECVFDKQESEPISAICHNRGNSLIYGCGNKLLMRTYEAETKRFEKSVIQPHMPSSAVRITAWGNLLFVTMQLHSTLVIRREGDGAYTKAYSEKQPRTGISHRLAGDLHWNCMSAVTNGVPAVIGWDWDDMRTTAEATLPCRVTQLAEARVRPRRKSRLLLGLSEPDVLGIATDGSLFSFNRINQRASRLLSMVQDMCLEDPRTRPVFPRHKFVPPVIDSVDRNKPGAFRVHIDGDILAQLLHLQDPCQALREMLDRDTPNSGVVESVAQRHAQFAELVGDVVGRQARDNEDMIERAIVYIHDVVELPF